MVDTKLEELLANVDDKFAHMLGALIMLGEFNEHYRRGEAWAVNAMADARRLIKYVRETRRAS